MSVENIFEYSKTHFAKVHILQHSSNSLPLCSFIVQHFEHSGILHLLQKYTFVYISCWMKLAFLHRKFRLDLFEKNNFMGFGSWTLQMFVSAVITQCLITRIAVKLSNLLTIFSNTYQILVAIAWFVTSLRHLRKIKKKDDLLSGAFTR